MNEFNERLVRIRERFVSRLDGKIANSVAALEKISGGDETIETVVVVHRSLHEMCGIAPTLGFTAIGHAARAAEITMREAAKTGRALTLTEAVALKSDLEALRAAAADDRQTYMNKK